MADVFLIHSLSDLFTRARNWIARLCRFSHPNLWMIMLFRTRCVGAESIYESLYNYAHISRECRFNIIKTDDRGNTIEHGLILCLQLSEGWGWGRIGSPPWCEEASEVTHQWSRPTGTAVLLKWGWHWEQHISSCSAYRVSSGWRQVERRCFEAGGVGAVSTPCWRSKGILVMLCNTLVMFHQVWTGSAWEKKTFSC